MAKIWRWTIIIFLLITVFSVFWRVPVSFDTGWHLASGRYYLENKTIPQTDIFSQTMPDFNWVNHEWLTDVVLYSLYSRFGLVSLTIFYAVMLLLTFYLITGLVKTNWIYRLLTTALASLAVFSVLGPKPQMITLFGLALILVIYNRYQTNPKIIFLIPFILLLWANLHGGFIIGLGLLFILIVFETVQKRKIKLLTALLAMSVLITLINPYGFQIYGEIFKTAADTLGNSLAKATISEWQPVSFNGLRAYYFWPYLILTLILTVVFRKKLSSLYIILSVIFLPLALSSWRHTPFFVLFSVPIYLESFSLLSEKSKIFRQLTNSWPLIIILSPFVYLALLNIFAISFSLNWPVIAAQKTLPQGAVRFIQANSDQFQGKMYNKYDYGSYLTFFLPEHKVFIDGRMLHWRQNNRSIYQDYFDIIHNFNFDLLDRYNIDWALLARNSVAAQKLFAEEKWQLKYLDSDAIILARPQK
ncbi:MAG TPA: hypothetical protein VGA49_01195 [Patescibacteria group bacterium]